LRAREAETQSEFVVYVTDQLRRWAPVSARRLFGGHGVYHGAIMFAIVSRDTLYLRTDDVNRPEFEAAGMGPFRVGKSGRIALSYHEVPSDVLEEAELLVKWAERAFAAALRRAEAKAALAAKAKKRRGNRPGRQPLKQRKG
jgi:DNA transformation protein